MGNVAKRRAPLGHARRRRGAVAGLLAAVALGGAVVVYWCIACDNRARPPETPSPPKRIAAANPPLVKSPASRGGGDGPSSAPSSAMGGRIERRESIPPPQPLAEMEVVATNARPRPAAFTTAAEELIALATPSVPGAYVPPLPEISDEGLAKDVEKALRRVIKAEDGDSVETLEKKVTVSTAKAEFESLRDQEGWGFAEYVNALRDQANDDAEFLAEAHKVSEQMYHDASISDDDYVKYRDQINDKLRERGLPEIENRAPAEALTDQ